MTPTTAHLLYFIFALGGVGIYFLLPKGEKSQMRAGAVVGLCGVAGLMLVLAARLIVPASTTGYFYLFATIAVLAAARVVTHPRPVYCALYFVLCVVAVAALLVLFGAEFLAVALIIVYAGAIIVTYLFVIMLAHQGGSPVYDRRSREPFAAVLAGFVLMAAVAGRAEELPTSVTGGDVVLASDQGTPEAPVQIDVDVEGNTSAIGKIVMTRYVVALEIAAVLLLVSMIGAIALSRKRVPVEGFAPPPEPLGKVGREVGPF